ncbi:lactate racemase domain-containing protein [Candidatus Neomarinimicrobiota bacterium]
MIHGKEILAGPLSREEVANIALAGMEGRDWAGKDVLVIAPDHTRKAPIGLFFRLIYDRLGQETRHLDYLIASGTHKAMDEGDIFRRVGITADDYRERYSKVRFFTHVYDDPAELREAGILAGHEMAVFTNGLFSEDMVIRINRRVYEYDHVIILGQVAPHEAAGFSGGHKYLIPGVADAEIISAFHWLAAIITNPVINGRRDNPVRAFLNRAAELISIDPLCFSFVVRDDGALECLYIGPTQESWEKAADCSARVHIITKPRPYETILGLAPTFLDDLWVGGKVMYKHEPILADGGELIIYAPHITELSYTHGAVLREIGYHVRDYFLGQWDKFRDYPKMILGHSTNVRGIGTYLDGVELPRVQVTLATGISPEVCQQVNLGYRNPADIEPEEWRGKEDDGLLVVENAGHSLYRLKAEAE